MKYIVGSLIISFAVLMLLVIVAMSMNLKAPEEGGTYFLMAWGILAVIAYPFARKIVR